MYPNISLGSPVLCKINEDSHWSYVVYCILYMLFCLTSVILLVVYAIPRIRERLANGYVGFRPPVRRSPRHSPLLRRDVPLRSASPADVVPLRNGGES